MVQIRSVDLRQRVPKIGSVVLQRAVWWSEDSRFVLIDYLEAGEPQEFGLRLDLDKKVFLDHLEDPDSDRALRDATDAIWTIVAQERNMTLEPSQTSALPDISNRAGMI